MAAGRERFRFSIDRGGTFTDVYAEVPAWCAAAGPRVLKLLSEDPANYENAPLEGIRRVLEEARGVRLARGEPVDASEIEWIRMGTTVATNGLLEREGSKFALVATEGFGDALEIGTQARPRIFDMTAKKLPPLYETVVEASERVVVESKRLVEQRALDVERLRRDLVEARRRDEGLDGVAIAFVHSYASPEHELLAAEVAREVGFSQISVSSSLLPMARLVPRGQTACVDAYLTPLISAYLESFLLGFKEPEAVLEKVLFMQSDGGLVRAAQFHGFRAVLSGPAGGVVGYAKTTSLALGDEDVPVIGFDMGGTSTDVSRYDGHLEHVFESETAGVTIQCPQLDVNTVAAGGGSRLFFREGALVVGPESAKADPGPVCYRKPGGLLALTDANLFLGRLLPERFPKIFGPSEDQPLDRAASERALLAVADRVDEFFGRPPGSTSPERLASGFVRVANETMCRPIRELSEARGFDPARHALACFGGAGAQHVCALARALGITRAVVHAYAGILSAYGIGLADVVVDRVAPCEAAPRLDDDSSDVRDRRDRLEAEARRDLAAQQPGATQRVERFLNLRYEGTDNAVMVMEPPDGDYAAAMAAAFKREYGFELAASKRVLVDDCRVRAVATSATPTRALLPPSSTPPAPVETCRIFFDATGWVDDAPVFELDRLGAGDRLDGPAVVAIGTSTCVLEPGCAATVTRHGDVLISVPPKAEQDDRVVVDDEAVVDPALLGVFGHRFMSIAEQMGRTLQRTASSVNIKERLDFSCALFAADGGLVANAPHVPVHLGAMSETVKAQLAKVALGPGDVVVANDPNAGGSHLPDITVISPLFFDDDDSSRPAFFCASRGHHADVGGSAPGSMPADSTSLDEEGAVIDAFLMVKAGVFDEAATLALLRSPAAKPPPPDKPHVALAACRNQADVLSDLKAQVAANAKGLALLTDLCREYGRPLVDAYCRHVRDNAAACVRAVLREAALARAADDDRRLLSVTLRADDRMDDGNPIALALSIRASRDDPAATSAVFDFSAGTGPEVRGNWNAPRAITSAAVMYCLRLLVGRDIPLNSGCLDPVEIRLGDHPSMLNPSPTAAVCAGNVLTSMRVTDVVLKAFGACAASQGCMNNTTFGDDHYGYYETVAGGAGAGPTWDGQSAVQCHMTNTRITDVETLEKRYPVRLDTFHVRRGSGGAGRRTGGDGVVRQITFLRPSTLNLLTERRALPPFGLDGGRDGARGRNFLVKPDGRRLALPAKAKLLVDAGDALRLETPGGGGYGDPDGPPPTPTALPLDTRDHVHRTASTTLSANAVDF